MSADDHAAAALKLARKKQAGGDDAGAMKMAQKSLRILESDEAQKLVDHIRKFGDDSEMAATARRIIEAADLYAVLQLAHDATPDDVKKAYHRTSKIVHPDKNKSRLKFREAFAATLNLWNNLLGVFSIFFSKMHFYFALSPYGTPLYNFIGLHPGCILHPPFMPIVMVHFSDSSQLLLVCFPLS